MTRTRQLTAHHGMTVVRIDGTPDAVAARVAQHRDAGRLVAMTTPRYVARGRVIVDVDLVPDRRQRTRRRVVIGGGVAAVAAVVAFVGWLVYRTVTGLAEFVTDHGGAIVGVIVLLAIVLLAAASRCPGLHCRGCSQ
jgi:hypothetical protein